jgi:large subunit ribosomal protein L29
MKVSEYRSMSSAEVQGHLAERERELTNLRFQLVTKQLPSPIAVQKTRREIARLKTVLREHELGLHILAAAPAAAGTTPGGAPEAKEK